MNNLKEINIKTHHPCYHFDDIIKIEDFDFDKNLLDGKSCENIRFFASRKNIDFA